jgi:tetratricopeptide (TPR) repeat protein
MRLGYLTHQVCEIDEAEEAFAQALVLATANADSGMEARALEMLCIVSSFRGENQPAVTFGRRAIAAAESPPGDALQVARSRNALSNALTQLGSFDEARRLNQANEDFYSASHNQIDLAVTQSNLATIDHLEGNFAAALDRYRSALEILTQLGVDAYAAGALIGMGALEVEEKRCSDAIPIYGRALDASLNGGNTAAVLYALAGIATAAAMTDARVATQIWAATTEQLKRRGVQLYDPCSSQAAGAADLLRRTLGDGRFHHEAEIGRALTLDQAVTRARELLPLVLS